MDPWNNFDDDWLSGSIVFLIFLKSKMAAVCHFGFNKMLIFRVATYVNLRCGPMQIFLWRLVERFKSYLNSKKSKMAAVCHFVWSEKVFLLLAMCFELWYECLQQIWWWLVELFKSKLTFRKSKMAAVCHLGCSKKFFYK